MKNLFIILALFTTLSTQFCAAQSDPMYYEVISNPEKTIDFTFGVLTSSVEYVTGNSPYSVMKMVVINNSKESLDWTSEEKILVILKDGTVRVSYTTVSKEGDYANDYTVPAGDKHVQYVCFQGAQFDPASIVGMHLIFGGSKTFKMVFDDGKEDSKGKKK